MNSTTAPIRRLRAARYGLRLPSVDLNRTIRFRLKAANAYHSDAGLQAMMAHETHAFNHPQTMN